MHPKVQSANHIECVSPIQLAAGDQVAGSIFRKQIMSYGRWVNPNWWWEDEIWMELTEEIADQFITNFNNKTFGKRISVPRNHTGDVNANAGEVIKLEKGPGGLWAYLDIRDPKTVADIENGLIFDVSMGFDLDYVDQKEGLHHGAVLIHVALVTDPYLNNMDDFAKADNVTLSKRFEEWAGSFGFGKSQPSLIMMSKSNVEELKRMKFAKVTNDQKEDVTVTYTDNDGKDQTVTVKPGEQVEVPAEVEEAVKSQIAAAAPADDDAGAGDGGEGGEGDPDLSGTAGQQQPAADPNNQSVPGQGDADGDEKDTKEQLAKALARNAELEADKKYTTLLSAGKITPAQKNLFMGFSRAGANATVTLSDDLKSIDGKKVLFKKGDTTSVTVMLSAILEAGPQVVKFGEQGGKGEGTAKDGEVELTAEQEAKLKKYGFTVETFKKQLAKGNIKLSVLDEEK